MPPATRALILINVGVYLLEKVAPDLMLGLFALWPLHTPLFRPWQLISYAFLHDPTNLAHIFFNMFALYMFGRTLEQFWGARRFVLCRKARDHGEETVADVEDVGLVRHGVPGVEDWTLFGPFALVNLPLAPNGERVAKA